MYNSFISFLPQCLFVTCTIFKLIFSPLSNFTELKFLYIFYFLANRIFQTFFIVSLVQLRFYSFTFQQIQLFRPILQIQTCNFFTSFFNIMFIGHTFKIVQVSSFVLLQKIFFSAGFIYIQFRPILQVNMYNSFTSVYHNVLSVTRAIL